ncbi:flagellar hook-basal body complex protein [Bacillus sp. 1NLA3E]|uniref:flagellar hook-basal body complex protein n=1 Tax=Bacillus sp. 1NLA3E TaxID=666686 RepID=UPI000247F434|nr:flagellar hook-basal body complex protein [Bacillus sp. 1NLA3E]AGK55399.1 flagellar hook protein FlgE [Bacillus sp. 1NLA3E]
MLNSFYTGVTGMKGFQTKLDVIGNNIANVNTAGFKKSRVVFQDFFNQNIAGPSAPTALRGGVNPKQIGLGTRIASIDTVHTPGSPVTTNIGTDLSIDGDAYFVVSPSNGSPVNYLTKAGNFSRDANGTLVNSNGYYVLGTNEDATLNPQPQIIKIIEDEVNLDPVTNLPLKFTSFSIDTNGDINVVDEDGNSGKLAINSTGKYYLNDGNTPATQNEIISIGTKVVSNPGGLKKVGNTMFEETANSGVSTMDRIVYNDGGQINSGALEMSNVDLTDEFTEMIVAQRGFQANAKTITTSDTIMDEIVNLKR